MILERIKQPNDIHKIPLSEFPQLAQEIRDFLIETMSNTGGHLASNMGVVELTMAIHNVFDLPKDKIIWDVGHQAYTHKILTGRKDEFVNLRKYQGLSGFPKRNESPCDSFDTGHSSNSISAGVGYVKARDLTKEDYRVVSVIGDGALTGGMAYEAMNNAAQLDTNFIIVLNDNKMSISENVGGMSQYLGNLRTAEAYTGMKINIRKNLSKIPGVGSAMVDKIHKTKNSLKQLMIPGMLFEDMGLTYLGPVNGHDLRQTMRVLNEAKKVEGAVIVHVLTDKGKGYEPAKRHPARFHGTAPFEIASGMPKSRGKAGYTDVFSMEMKKIGERNEKVVAITAAMPDGTGLKRFANAFPKRFFDVGIAEEHAVTYAAGMALGGLIPVFAVYSSFLQRGFDQVMHDVCMQNLHVVFAIDRAGLVGSDGETHQGAFDFSYLSMMPNMTIMAPKNKWELADMLQFAVDHDGPIAVRYPRGEAYEGLEAHRAPVCLGKSEVLHKGSKVAILAIGSMVSQAVEVAEILKEQGWDPTLVNARFVKPLDTEILDRLAADHDFFVTMEENVKSGGFGEKVMDYMYTAHPQKKVLVECLPDRFIEQGSVSQLYKEVGLDAHSIAEDVKKEIE